MVKLANWQAGQAESPFGRRRAGCCSAASLADPTATDEADVSFPQPLSHCQALRRVGRWFWICCGGQSRLILNSLRARRTILQPIPVRPALAPVGNGGGDAHHFSQETEREHMPRAARAGAKRAQSHAQMIETITKKAVLVMSATFEGTRPLTKSPGKRRKRSGSVARTRTIERR